MSGVALIVIHIGQPIATIPDDRKDGRDVLLWAGRPLTGMWVDEWCDTVLGQPIVGVTHWADVQGPEGDACPVR